MSWCCSVKRLFALALVWEVFLSSWLRASDIGSCQKQIISCHTGGHGETLVHVEMRLGDGRQVAAVYEPNQKRNPETLTPQFRKVSYLVEPPSGDDNEVVLDVSSVPFGEGKLPMAATLTKSGLERHVKLLVGEIPIEISLQTAQLDRFKSGLDRDKPYAVQFFKSYELADDVMRLFFELDLESIKKSKYSAHDVFLYRLLARFKASGQVEHLSEIAGLMTEQLQKPKKSLLFSKLYQQRSYALYMATPRGIYAQGVQYGELGFKSESDKDKWVGGLEAGVPLRMKSSWERVEQGGVERFERRTQCLPVKRGSRFLYDHSLTGAGEEGVAFALPAVPASTSDHLSVVKLGKQRLIYDSSELKPSDGGEWTDFQVIMTGKYQFTQKVEGVVKEVAIVSITSGQEDIKHLVLSGSKHHFKNMFLIRAPYRSEGFEWVLHVNSNSDYDHDKVFKINEGLLGEIPALVVKNNSESLAVSSHPRFALSDNKIGVDYSYGPRAQSQWLLLVVSNDEEGHLVYRDVDRSSAFILSDSFGTREEQWRSLGR